MTAERAFPAGAKSPQTQRSNLLRTGFDMIIANREDLALILPRAGQAAREELVRSISAAPMSILAEEARRVYGETIPHAAGPDCAAARDQAANSGSAARSRVEFPCSVIFFYPKSLAGAARRCTVDDEASNERRSPRSRWWALARKGRRPPRACSTS